PIREMRREEPRDTDLSKGWSRAEDQLGLGNGSADIGGDELERDIMMAAKVLERDRAACLAMGGNGIAVASPHSNAVPCQREVARRGEGPVAAAQHCDLHVSSPVFRVSTGSALAVQVEGALQQRQILQQLRLRLGAQIAEDGDYPFLMPARHAQEALASLARQPHDHAAAVV